MAQKDLPYWQADELKAGVVEMMLMMVMVVMRTTADISHLICLEICSTGITLFNLSTNVARSIFLI